METSRGKEVTRKGAGGYNTHLPEFDSEKVPGYQGEYAGLSCEELKRVYDTLDPLKSSANRDRRIAILKVAHAKGEDFIKYFPSQNAA